MSGGVSTLTSSAWTRGYWAPFSPVSHCVRIPEGAVPWGWARGRMVSESFGDNHLGKNKEASRMPPKTADAGSERQHSPLGEWIKYFEEWLLGYMITYHLFKRWCKHAIAFSLGCGSEGWDPGWCHMLEGSGRARSQAATSEASSFQSQLSLQVSPPTPYLFSRSVRGKAVLWGLGSEVRSKQSTSTWGCLWGAL